MAIYKECKTLKFPGSDIIYVITDNGKVAVSQGVENAGKVLGVGEDGSVTLIDAKNLETEIPVELLTYTEQTLTIEQKEQARANIGAGTSNFSGSYNDLSDKPDLSAGDMMVHEYDPNGEIAAAGGIAAWITATYDNAEEMSY